MTFANCQVACAFFFVLLSFSSLSASPNAVCVAAAAAARTRTPAVRGSRNRSKDNAAVHSNSSPLQTPLSNMSGNNRKLMTMSSMMMMVNTNSKRDGTAADTAADVPSTSNMPSDEPSGAIVDLSENKEEDEGEPIRGFRWINTGECDEC
mmetsp:Transcript_8854/g.14732  ORF Transcript_8854/g.14732 Transcript_8854/m.14732 type:complete len:150 (-) Transcript_8854:59-508(-)